MKILYTFLPFLFLACSNDKGINATQMTRVEIAYQEKSKYIEKVLEQAAIESDSIRLFLRAFKQEQKLEVWAKNQQEVAFKKLLTYDFCVFSGDLGPKRMEGDLQIPEGIYYINRFNPLSKFHLSLGLNYPNASDKKLGHPTKIGSDIFIHGGCSSVGCIAITDDKIKELYILAELAKQNGQSNIPCHIFPFPLTTQNIQSYNQSYPNHVAFWKSLQPIYQQFETVANVY